MTEYNPENQPSFDELTSGTQPENEPQPVEPAIYRKGKDLVLVGGAALPSNVCIKSGTNPNAVISVGIHNPFKPQTWFGGHKAVIGLDRASQEKYRLQQTTAFALIGLGALMLPLGIFSGIATAIAGLILLIAGFVVRSLIPVWSLKSEKDSIVIRGCGEAYLNFFQDTANNNQQ